MFYIRDLHNYLVWQVVQNHVDFLSQEFQEAAKVMEKALMGVVGTDEVWRECVMQTSNALGKPVGAMFVREAFGKELKEMVSISMYAYELPFVSGLFYKFI